jgi:hypothetical protein
VDSLVLREVTLVCRLILAEIASKRLLSSVHAKMAREVALVVGAVLAALAPERLLSGVGPEVLSQCRLFCRSVVAQVACKRLLARVSATQNEERGSVSFVDFGMKLPFPMILGFSFDILGGLEEGAV